MRQRKNRGFTLIELMIVLVIVAILAAFAIPTFFSQMRKSRRSEIMTTLQDQQLHLERWRVDNASFATYTFPSGLSNAYYTVSLSGATPTAYTLTAAPEGDQAKDSCGTLTLTNTAGVIVKSPTDCW